jgi:hypothetical protein
MPGQLIAFGTGVGETAPGTASPAVVLYRRTADDG